MEQTATKGSSGKQLMITLGVPIQISQLTTDIVRFEKLA